MNYPNPTPVILAIDPGKSGAVCRLDGENIEAYRDFKELPDIANAIQKLSFGVTHLIMEAVHAMPGQGVVSMFSFGRSAGVADGAMAICCPELRPDYVTPQKWQGHFRLQFGIQKGEPFCSRTLALRLFPSKTELFKRKLDHNTADAVLMAVWKRAQLL